MRIVILIYDFPPQVLGGTEIATYSIAKHLVQRGHEVHVVTTWGKGLPRERIEDGFTVHRSRVIVKPVLGSTSYFIHAYSAVKKINPDLIHAQNISLALYALLIKKTLKKPYVTWAQGSDIYLPSRFFRWFYKFNLKNAGAVIAQTSDEKGIMQKICDRDIMILPSGIDLGRFSNLSRESSRSGLQIKKGEKVILFVGKLHAVKGVNYLIQAMNVIRQKEPKTRLILVGDGEERRDLEKLTSSLNLADSVTFVGKVPNEKVPQYMAAADIFVLPSLSEGFPMVIVEAMASGLPIVTTNVTGLPEIVHNGENGLLVEPKNSVELAEKILLLLQDDELRGDIAQNNRQRAKDYTWEKVVDNLEEVYQKVVAPL
jgi:glycosyltransferase involved in cell wall biosynthesis